MLYYKDIVFQKPLPDEIRRLGLIPADLHFHTRHSDSPTRVRDALKLAARRGIGLAITDHNQVSGVAEAERQGIRVPLVPGIEVSANDGPHILLYFYSASDLRDFYRRHIEKNRRDGSPPRYASTPGSPDRRDYACIGRSAPCGWPS